MIDYFSFSKVQSITVTNNGFIALCGDGSIYLVSCKDENQDIEDFVIKPIYQTQNAKDFFQSHQTPPKPPTPPSPREFRDGKPIFRNPSVKSTH